MHGIHRLHFGFIYIFPFRAQRCSCQAGRLWTCSHERDYRCAITVRTVVPDHHPRKRHAHEVHSHVGQAQPRTTRTQTARVGKSVSSDIANPRDASRQEDHDRDLGLDSSSIPSFWALVCSTPADAEGACTHDTSMQTQLSSVRALCGSGETRHVRPVRGGTDFRGEGQSALTLLKVKLERPV